MSIAHLDDRGVVRVAGEEAGDLLQNLLTCDIDATAPQWAGYGALLSPQGKILFDFIVHRISDGTFLFDIAAYKADAFVKRLGFYRLRAKVEIENVTERYAVLVGWGEDSSPPDAATTAPDPRLSALGWRAVIERLSLGDIDTKLISSEAYHAHRIALAIPEGGKDFLFDDAFPHEADMDQLNGVAFQKGCYIGQEVVSRMQHRGTARTRVISASFNGEIVPESGTEITANGKPIGRVGSTTHGNLLATIRIDKAQDAIVESQTILAGDCQLTLHKPEWATFSFSSQPENPTS